MTFIFQCSPHEFYSICKALETVYESFKMFREAVNTSKASDWLKQLVAEIPELLCDTEDFSKALNEKEARYDVIFVTFNGICHIFSIFFQMHVVFLSYVIIFDCVSY